MKKLLTILSSFAITATGVSTIVACGKSEATNSDLTPQQKADAAKEKLKALDITISVAYDEKTKDKVIEHIKNATEVTQITDKYTATIDELTVKLSDDSDLEDSKVANDLVLKVSGKITVETATADFELAKVTLKVITEEDKHKQQANDAVTALSELTGITFKTSELGTSKKTDALNTKLLADDKIKAIITGDITLESGKFTFKVADKPADDKNLIHEAEVTVSGKIDVKGQKSDNDFKFTIKIEDTAANVAVKKLTELKGITVKPSLLDKDKAKIVSSLNDKILADDKIKAIITGDITLESGKFTFKVADKPADDKNLIHEAEVTVSGKIDVNGQESDNEFKFIVKLEESDAEAAAIRLTGLTGITIKVSDLGSDDTTKINELNTKLLAHTDISAIIHNDVKIETGKFTFKVATIPLKVTDLKEKVIIIVSGKIEIKGVKSTREFVFSITLT